MSSTGEIDYTHEPVLLQEVLEWLKPEKGGTFIDCTLGLGGHAEAMLEASPMTTVIGLDQDPEALALAASRLARFEGRFRALHANFKDLGEVLKASGLAQVQGVLADIGVSSLQ